MAYAAIQAHKDPDLARVPLPLKKIADAFDKAALGRTIEVPLDHRDPAKGRASLSYEFGAAYDPKKPVVLVLVDGQQFHQRRGVMAGWQKDLFGDGVNVVSILA